MNIRSDCTPNLLEHARSELAQDALIAWFVAWARPGCQQKHPGLHGSAVEFLREITSRQASKEAVDQVSVVKVHTQWNGADLLIVVNHGEHLILIEDKAGTQEHDHQLDRYRERLREAPEWVEKESTRHYIYLQTLEQSDVSEAGRAGYSVVRRADLIAALRRAREIEPGLDNAIHSDWLAYLETIAAAVDRWRHEPLGNWHGDWMARQGFLEALKEETGEGAWWYVANPSGGFLGYFMAGASIGGVKHFLQLETYDDRMRLLVRVESNEERGTGSQRDERWVSHERVLAAGKECGLTLKKPSRFGAGKTYSVAEFEESPLRCADGSPCGPDDLACIRQTSEFILGAHSMLARMGESPPADRS